MASIARDLQRLAKKKDNLFVVFSIDEFHLVAPNDDSTVTTQVLRELARIGRHYKIGLILTTQSPQDVDRSILKRLLTRFLHSIEPDQLDALRGVFSDASSTSLARCRSYRKEPVSSPVRLKLFVTHQSWMYVGATPFTAEKRRIYGKTSLSKVGLKRSLSR